MFLRVALAWPVGDGVLDDERPHTDAPCRHRWPLATRSDYSTRDPIKDFAIRAGDGLGLQW